MSVRTMRMSGRMLWLTEDARALASQLRGETHAFDPRSPPALVYGVNTDAMISGAACTLGYTPEILGSHFLENFAGVVGRDSVRVGRFDVVVAGDAYGSGSSREVAVVAHVGAGIRLVVAKSFQRIFQENMVYGGLPFTTNFGILERIAAGDDIDLDALADELPPFFRSVAKGGGLLRYGSALLAGTIAPPVASATETRPLTCVEKIIAKRAYTGRGIGVPSVRPGDQLLCEAGFRGVHEYTGGMVIDLYRREWGNTKVARPELVAAFEDHFVLLGEESVQLDVRRARLEPARNLAREMVDAAEQNGLRLHGPGRTHSAGVCHRIVLEEYGLPGTIVVLTDSHTPTAGVLNAFAFGVGSTAMAFALRTGWIPVTVPKTVRVILDGKPRAGLSPKDLILHLIGDPYFREEHWRASPTDTCVIEFGGPGLDAWDVDELSVLTNMTVEGGLMTGIVEPCASVREFLRQRGISDDEIVRSFVHPDPGAHYVRTIEVDLASVPITIATPGDSRNRALLADHKGVPIHNVVIASCTGGSVADLRAAADVLRGRRIHPNVRVTVSPSSARVSDAAERAGLLSLFRKLGAIVTPPGCGSCIGNGPGIPNVGETTASTTNRNFDRRMGAEGPVYLVSPSVAAACAVTGTLASPEDLDPPSEA